MAAPVAYIMLILNVFPRQTLLPHNQTEENTLWFFLSINDFSIATCNNVVLWVSYLFIMKYTMCVMR